VIQSFESLFFFSGKKDPIPVPTGYVEKGFEGASFYTNTGGESA
jgi:hypothetical protein